MMFRGCVTLCNACVRVFTWPYIKWQKRIWALWKIFLIFNIGGVVVICQCLSFSFMSRLTRYPMATCNQTQTFRNEKLKWAMAAILFSFAVAVTEILRNENFKCDKSQNITLPPGKIKDANDVNFSVGNLGLSLKKSKIEGKTDLTQIYEKNVASPKFLQCYWNHQNFTK